MAAGNREQAAHAQLSPFTSVGVRSTAKQLCSALFGTPTEVNRQSCMSYFSDLAAGAGSGRPVENTIWEYLFNYNSESSLA